MKSISSAIIIVGLLGLLAYTNPTLDDFEIFIRQQMIQDSKTDVERALTSLLGGFASRVVINQTIRKDYVFLSTYDTPILGNEHLRVLGIAKNFIILEKPSFLNKPSSINTSPQPTQTTSIEVTLNAGEEKEAVAADPGKDFNIWSNKPFVLYGVADGDGSRGPDIDYPAGWESFVGATRTGKLIVKGSHDDTVIKFFQR